MMFRSRLGFWSLDLSSGEVTCDRVTAGIFGIVGPCRRPLAQLLARFDPASRYRVLRAGLRCVRGARGFDITALVQAPFRPAPVRVIGGRGYRLDSSVPELHGVAEQAEWRGPDPDHTVFGEL